MFSTMNPRFVPGVTPGNALVVRRSKQSPSIRRILVWGRQACSPAAYAVALILAIVFGFSAAQAQDQRRRKIPVVDKITSGAYRQAFSGKLETMDLKRHVLEVDALEGKGMEIFPVKKGISVSTAGGEKLKLNELRPGNNIIIYYEQKGDRRTVKEIVVLAAGADEENRKTSPPS